MPVRIILLRAVNVGGKSTLPMADLRRIGEEAGLDDPRTYIASGNLLGHSDAAEARLKATIEAGLAAHMGRPTPVAVRTAEELADLLSANPFAGRDPRKTVAIFLDATPAKDALSGVTGMAREEIALGRREIHVHYPDGIGRSKLKIPTAAKGTARNLNTVAALVELARQ